MPTARHYGREESVLGLISHRRTHKQNERSEVTGSVGTESDN